MNPNTTMHGRLRRAIDESVRDCLAKHPGCRGFGTYWQKVNGLYVSVDTEPMPLPTVDDNLIPTEGLNNLLDTWLGTLAKPAGWYIGLYSGAVAPASSWTAANVAANSTEITSQVEGYSEATRQQWVESGNAAGGVIDNIGSEAAFTIVCSTTINVNGAFLISNSARGGTTGKLASAARYGSVRVLNNGDDYEVGYRSTFTSS